MVGRNRLAIASALCLPLVAAPVAGQSRGGAQPVKAVSVEVTMDQLARELVNKLREQAAISNLLSSLHGKVNLSIDSTTRRTSLRRTTELTARLKSLEAEGGRLREMLRELCATLTADGYLGFVLQGETSAQRFGTYDRAPTVVSIEPGSPAERAGVAPGDIVLAVGGRSLESGTMADLHRLLRPGARLTLRVKRGVETKQLMATVAPRPSGARSCPVVDETFAIVQDGVPGLVTLSITTDDSLPDSPRVVINGSPVPNARGGQQTILVPTPSSPSVATGYAFTTRGDPNQAVIAGATLSTMKGALLETFGVDRGVLVLSVLPGSPFATAGLREGDVILSIASEEPNTPYEVQRSLRRAEGEISVQVMRKKKRVTLALPCPRC